MPGAEDQEAQLRDRAEQRVLEQRGERVCDRNRATDSGVFDRVEGFERVEGSGQDSQTRASEPSNTLTSSNVNTSVA